MIYLYWSIVYWLWTILIIFIKLGKSLWEKNILVSSANKTRSKIFQTLQRSFVYNKKKRGLRTDPWGTPHLILFKEEWIPEKYRQHFYFSWDCLAMQTQKSFIKMTMLHIEIVNEICLGIFFLRKGFTAQWRSGRGAGRQLPP